MNDTDEPRSAEKLDASSAGDVTLIWLVAVLIRERRLIYAFTAIGLVLSLAVALNRKKTYTTTFSFISQTAQDPGGGSLANIAGQFGLSLGMLSGVGQTTPPQLYADLLATREILTPIALDSFVVDPDVGEAVPLANFLKIKDKEAPVVLEKTLRALRRDVIATTVAIRTTGVVTVSVRTESQNISYQIAERLLEGLNHFNLVTRQSQAREERRFTEERLASARKAQRDAEALLQEFLEANRNFSRSPSLTFEHERLQGDLRLQQQIVATLAQQYEENRIQEVRDTPVITLIDSPVVAGRPNARLRLVILVLGLVGGVGTGVLVVLGRDAIARQLSSNRDPAVDMLSKEWRRFRGKLPS